MSGIFGIHAHTYRAMGLEPRPIKPGSKACKIPGWERSDAEIGGSELDGWLTKYALQGIGLRTGTHLADGTKFGAVDLDDDSLVRVGRALLGPTCERVGAKGSVSFVRYVGDLPRKKFTREGDGAHLGDLLVKGALVVLPPTIHPDTGQPYRWLTAPLTEFKLSDLPIIGIARDLGVGQ